MRRHPLTLFAVLGALALALPLSACGRKGPLDPPPGGYSLQSIPGRTPVSRRGVAPEKNTQKENPQQYDEDGRPIIPQGQNRRLPADWLID